MPKSQEQTYDAIHNYTTVHLLISLVFSLLFQSLLTINQLQSISDPDCNFGPSNHLKLKMGELEDCVRARKRQPPCIDLQNSLKQEILELQDRLEDHFVVPNALQKALNCRPLPREVITDKSFPKPAKELIKDIAVLELEVAYLERYLLCLYRKTFDQQASSLSTKDEDLKTDSKTHEGILQHHILLQTDSSVNDTSNPTFPRSSIGNPPHECNGILGPGVLLDSSIQRCHSSLSNRWTRASPPKMRSIARDLDSYHSLPLSMLEQAQDHTSNGTRFADHLGKCIYVQESPNWLSEEMIKRISTIYCELADPPLMGPDLPTSPISDFSSQNEFPSQGHSYMWSPQYGNFSSFNSSFDNPFHIRESKEVSGPYCTMAKIESICRDSKKMKDMQSKIQDFRSLVSRLEVIDPRKMKHEEKLAFWINVHNALAMHAFLVYGIPESSMKRMSLALKAAYNIGGRTINVEMIQGSVLGCRLLRPGQWLRHLFTSRTKFKFGDTRKAYSIDHPEPRLHFALCSGSYSDPAVRMYTPKRVFEDLEAAKEEYIQSTFNVHKEKKLLLPKIVDSFAKDLELCPAGLSEMIEHLLPNSMRRRIQQYQFKKFGKNIEWIPHNFTFRLLLSKELVY